MKITNDYEFISIAKNFYNNGEGNTEVEFEKDLRVFKQLQHQLGKYHRGERRNVREIVNYYIILSNLFSLAVDVMLRYKIQQHLHPYIATLQYIFKNRPKDQNCFSEELYNDIKEIL